VFARLFSTTTKEVFSASTERIFAFFPRSGPNRQERAALFLRAILKQTGDNVGNAPRRNNVTVLLPSVFRFLLRLRRWARTFVFGRCWAGFAPCKLGYRRIDKLDRGVQHAYAGAVSSLSEAGVGEFFPHRCFRVGFSAPRYQSVRQRPAGLRPEVWTTLLGLPRVVAPAEQFRLEIQRQWLSVDERARFSHLAESLILAGDLPHHANLAPREQY
jgi:hypothetical protein